MPPSSDILSSDLHRIIQGDWKTKSVSLGSSGLCFRENGISGTARKKRKLSEESDLLDSHNAGIAIVDNWDLLGTTAVNQASHVIIKSECESLAYLADRAKLWLLLSSRSSVLGKKSNADDEEGFRDELLSELHRAQDAAIGMRDVTLKYRLTRADICAKVIQYPGIEDYKLALQEFDEQDLFLAKQHFHDILNIYMLLHDLFKCIAS